MPNVPKLYLTKMFNCGLMTREPCSSYYVNYVWLTPNAFFCLVVRKGFLLATLPMRLWLWRWHLMIPGDLKTPQGLQFFHCDLWGFCYFSYHSPQYPRGRDAVAFSTHEFINSSISFELLYNCSDSAQCSVLNRLLIFL